MGSSHAFLWVTGSRDVVDLGLGTHLWSVLCGLEEAWQGQGQAVEPERDQRLGGVFRRQRLQNLE